MFVVMEEPLDRSTEEPGDGEGQRQGGQIAAGLDRVDRLAGDAQLLRELALAEATTLALPPHFVGHGFKLACQSGLCQGRLSARRGPDGPVRRGMQRQRRAETAPRESKVLPGGRGL